MKVLVTWLHSRAFLGTGFSNCCCDVTLFHWFFTEVVSVILAYLLSNDGLKEFSKGWLLCCLVAMEDNSIIFMIEIVGQLSLNVTHVGCLKFFILGWLFLFFLKKIPQKRCTLVYSATSNEWGSWSTLTAKSNSYFRFEVKIKSNTTRGVVDWLWRPSQIPILGLRFEWSAIQLDCFVLVVTLEEWLETFYRREYWTDVFNRCHERTSAFYWSRYGL